MVIVEESKIHIIIPDYTGSIPIGGIIKEKYKYKKVRNKQTKETEEVKYLSNPKTANKPKSWTVNGNQLYSQGSHFTRALYMKKLKEYILEAIDKTVIIPKSWVGNIQISLTIYDLYPDRMNSIWDLDNKWPWIKAFTDVLVDEKILLDDSIDFIRSNGQINYIEVKENRRLAFTITKI